MDSEARIAEEALRWFEKLNADAGIARDKGQRTAFMRWLQRSPRNVQHFLYATALDRTLDSIDREKKLDVEAMLREARGTLVKLDGREIRSARIPSRPHGDDGTRKVLASMAAAIVLAAGAAWWYVGSVNDRERFATTTGEQRAVQLSDGSVVQLNTQSRMQVHLSGSVREIELLEGEALFKVAPDQRRPFQVRAGGSVIRAVGTQFNVYRQADAVAVAVLEGRVAVAADGRDVLLDAGEEARVQDGAIAKDAKADVSAAVAWRQRRLVFKSQPLGEVTEQFNRYNRSPKIRLQGLDGDSRHYTGTFDADDPQSLALLLAQDKTLAIETRDGDIVVRRR